MLRYGILYLHDQFGGAEKSSLDTNAPPYFNRAFRDILDERNCGDVSHNKLNCQ